MISSKSWNWKIVKDKDASNWLNPSIESFYLLNRWNSQDKRIFLDLGCGLGRHTILFAKNGFKVYAFDLSANAIERTKQWLLKENLIADCKIGDMLELPYDSESIDCILCRNVISHTDTEGMKKIVNEIYRVLKKDGECYLTLGSKDTWGFKQKDWPLVDCNTRIRMDEGPEKGIPHFYADYNLILELFCNFEIDMIYQVEDFFDNKGKKFSSFHYHVLIKKTSNN